MNKKVFHVDNNNKEIKWLSTCFQRLVMWPFIDILVLLLLFTGIIHFLDVLGERKLYSNGVIGIYIWSVVFYIFLGQAIAFYDFFKYRKISRTIVVKENNNIALIRTNFVLKGAASTIAGGALYRNLNSMPGKLASLGLFIFGAKKAQKSINDIPAITDEEVIKILDEKPSGYKIYDYKECKLVGETRKYYKFSGNINGVASNFKIHKVYSNMDLLVGEGL